MTRADTIVMVVFALVQLCCGTVWSRPTTAFEAQQAVTGWLSIDQQPLDTTLGWQVVKVETFNDEGGDQVYYIVYLQPAGFVIVSADDLIEPIVGFADDGTYDPSLDNPLGALVSNDLNGRMAALRNAKSLEAPARMEEALKSQAKWGRLISLADGPEDGPVSKGRTSISEVRVAPLVQTRWSQGDSPCPIFPFYCYNYYTPNHYPCGCVATAMAQLMRYYQHPASGIGVHGFTITVDGASRTAYTRGGDGSGGPYQWSKMVLVPDCATGDDKHRAIGALCYDAGVSVNMNYASGGSWAYADSPRYALTNTFQYENAVVGVNGWANIGPGLTGMVNPNLDAKSPVILSIGGEGAHAVVCDGYGHDSRTLYHHINMGWGGADDAWYNLPNIDASYNFNSVDACIYNIRTTGSGDGEVISGRVLYANGDPIPNADVSFPGIRSRVFTKTDSRGIYSFSDLDSNTSYVLTASVRAYTSSSQTIVTGASLDNQATSGNVWGIDFVLTRLDKLYVDDDAPDDPDPGNPTVSDPLEDGSNQHPFDNIQEAINVSVNGNEIEVAPGTYNEAINFSGKAIRLYSGTGPDATIINGTGNYHVVQCVNSEDADTILEGFTITGGNANGPAWPNNCGGGMYNERSCPVIIDCNFTGNNAYDGGGICNDWYADAQITKCIFHGNTASHNGGGMCNINTSSPTVTNCSFIDNTSNSHGGGMYNRVSSPKLTNCIFGHNTANGHGGGMINSVSSSSTVTNCTFSGNTAGLNGDGMFNNDNSNPIVTNCIFWGDTPEEINNLASTPIVTYSDIQGGWSGTGNINVDPLFVDAIGGNLRLSSGSPCIDKGSNAGVPSGIANDLDGRPRIVDGECNDIDVVDIGAYEFNCAYMGDFDDNCSVDFFDFSILAHAWMTQDGDPDWDWTCDVSNPPDDYIDWCDLAIIAENWLRFP